MLELLEYTHYYEQFLEQRVVLVQPDPVIEFTQTILLERFWRALHCPLKGFVSHFTNIIKLLLCMAKD